jgi:FPC/CPF motif-containing protein YcgG
MQEDSKAIIETYRSFLKDRDFPCLAVKSVLARQQLACMVADHMACPKDDVEITEFLYRFVDRFRMSGNSYHSAAVIFREPRMPDEELFDRLFWDRLQAFADIDAMNYAYDYRVAADPSSPDFSYSLKGEAFYIVGMHPSSSRKSRRFAYPAMVFNPHHQFEQLRENNQYRKMQQVVRKRDINYSGSVNPMLADFGSSSEALQYSGRQYPETWECPLILNHGKAACNTSS